MNSKILFLIVLSLATASKADISKEKFSAIITSDSYKTNADQSADLEGHVKVIRDSEVLTCDRAKVNNATGEVEAQGNVVLMSLKDYVRAEKINYNFISKKAVIYKGLIQTGQETIEGEEITRLSENQFVATHASYTTCVNCPPSWKFTGRKIDATVGGYAYITEPVVRLYSVPVLWLPWIALPIKNERQSGFLPPFYSISGAGGPSYEDSYFWAIDKSTDATFTETYFEQRGFKHGLEYRFVSSADSHGIFHGNFLNDKLFPNTDDYRILDSRYIPIPGVKRESLYDLSRFSVRYNQHIELPEGFTNNVDLNLVRDTRYLYDFSNEMPFAGDAALENRTNLTKNTENTHSSLDVDVYENLLKTDPLGQNDLAVHRIPEVNYSLMPLKVLGPELLGLDINYVNFTRAGRTFNDSTSVADFSTTSKYKTGQRIALHPSVFLPLNLWNIFDIVPLAEYEETYYEFGYSSRPTTARRFLRTSINSKMRFSAILGENNDDAQATLYKHEIIPEVTYSVVPYFYQEDHPFFGNTNQPFQPIYTSNQPITEFDNLQFDYRDRLADRNLVTFGVTNKFIRKKWSGDVPAYREIILHRLTQSYDISSEQQPNTVRDTNNQEYNTIKQPYGEIRSLLEVKLDYFSTFSDASYYPYENKTNSATSIAIRNSRGDGVGVGYSQGYQITPNYTTGKPPISFGARSESATASVFFKSAYLDLSGTAGYDILNHYLSTIAISGIIKPPGKCWGIRVDYSKTFGADRMIHFSFPIFFGEGRSFDMSRPPGV